ncbi:PLP-dependent transferase, partial [Bacillus sp. D-CC]
RIPNVFKPRSSKKLSCGPRMNKVYYPGLESHQNHELATEQANGFGAIISFDVDSEETLNKVLERLQYFTLAESLGAVEIKLST